MMKAILIMLMAALSLGSLSAQHATMDQLVEQYLALKNSMVAGDAGEGAKQANAFHSVLTRLNPTNSATDELLKLSLSVAKAKGIEEQRSAFGLMSVEFWKVVKAANWTNKTLFYNYCPMKKAYWISDEKEIRNPFYGNRMLSCGNTTEKTENR